MAQRKKTRTRRPARRRSSATRARAASALPATLPQLTSRMRTQLGKLETQIDRVQARTRRQAARLLREASEELGRLQALGQARWRELDARARRRLLDLLRRLDQAVRAGGRVAGRGNVARQAVRQAQHALRRAADALDS